MRSLQGFLHRLTENRALWGLPQGFEASAILGNFYLLPVDRALLRHDVRAIRYQDDIKIFAADRATLRLALRDIHRVLRARHLNLSVHKTKILEGRAVLEEFEDTRKDAIQYGLDAGSSDAPVELRKLFDDAVASDPVKARDIRFAVYRLAQLNDPHGVSWIIENLADVPYLASHLVRYLSQYIDEKPEIEERVSAFLLDPIENMFPWTEMHLVRLLRRAKTIRTETHSTVGRVLADRNRDVLVREHAARCFAIHAKPGDAPLLRDMAQTVDELSLRRALLVAYTEAGDRKKPDKALLGAVERDQPELAPTCKFLRSPATIPKP